MPMKLFTLSAICMLVFCMLLALSGTTDFPGHDPEFAPGADLVQPHTVSPRPAHDLISAGSVPEAHGSEVRPAEHGQQSGPSGRNGLFFLFGLLTILGWVVLGLRFFSSD